MDYLTNYYKNLSEQLQEKLNILEAQINEGRYNPETGKVERFRDDMRQTTDKLERKAPSTGSFKVDNYSSTESLNPANIIPRNPKPINYTPTIGSNTTQHGGDYFPTPGRKPESIIPRPQSEPNPDTDEYIGGGRYKYKKEDNIFNFGSNTTQQSQDKPLEKDTIKSFIQSIRGESKPGEKIKKTPSKIPSPLRTLIQ